MMKGLKPVSAIVIDSVLVAHVAIVGSRPGIPAFSVLLSPELPVPHARFPVLTVTVRDTDEFNPSRLWRRG